jgi:hypothetical protein
MVSGMHPGIHRRPEAYTMYGAVGGRVSRAAFAAAPVATVDRIVVATTTAVLMRRRDSRGLSIDSIN